MFCIYYISDTVECLQCQSLHLINPVFESLKWFKPSQLAKDGLTIDVNSQNTCGYGGR